MRTSLQKLTTVKVEKGQGEEIKAALKAVQDSLNKLSTETGTEFKSQVDALQSALNKAQTATTNLVSNPSAKVVGDTVVAVGEVITAGRQLLNTLSTRCRST